VIRGAQQKVALPPKYTGGTQTPIPRASSGSAFVEIEMDCQYACTAPLKIVDGSSFRPGPMVEDTDTFWM